MEEYQKCFCARRPDGIVVDKKKETCYILEFKRKMDRWMGYREEATDRATNQYASLMHGLQGVSTSKELVSGNSDVAPSTLHSKCGQWFGLAHLHH